MGRCARLAWEHAVAEHQRAAVPRPGVTTGHILLGVLKEELCAGGLLLARLQLDLKLAYATTEFVLLHSRRRAESTAQVATWNNTIHSQAARQVLDFTLEEANLTSATYAIGTEHLLLGLLRVPDSMGYGILRYFGLDVHQVRAARDRLWDLLQSPE